jgi:ribose-phosphate pyrophosphokinase
MLQELVAMGVSNIITFDAHDPRICNAIPLEGFDDVRPTYQMIKALVRSVPDIIIDKDSMMIISPDEGAMQRCMFFSSVLGLDIGMFYKRRNYSIVVNGKNPIEAHEYLGQDLHGKDVLIVDDMISSGESLLDVATQLKSRGAKRVFACASFGLFTDGCDKFDKAYEAGIIDRVLSTNLVYRRPELAEKPWFVEVEMSKYVSYIIETLNHDTTISELLDPVTKINALMEKHKADLAAQAQIKMEI